MSRCQNLALPLALLRNTSTAFTARRSARLLSTYYFNVTINPLLEPQPPNASRRYPAFTNVSTENNDSELAYRPPPDLRHLRIRGERVLWIDTIPWAYGNNPLSFFKHDASDEEGYSSKSCTETVPLIQEAIAQDVLKIPSERFGSLLWYIDHRYENSTKVWKAIDGLSPKHVHLAPGKYGPESEKFFTKPLDLLKNQWTELESLSLIGVRITDLASNMPKAFTRISSLTMQNCDDSSPVLELCFKKRWLEEMYRERVTEKKSDLEIEYFDSSITERKAIFFDCLMAARPSVDVPTCFYFGRKPKDRGPSGFEDEDDLFPDEKELKS